MIVFPPPSFHREETLSMRELNTDDIGHALWFGHRAGLRIPVLLDLNHFIDDVVVNNQGDTVPTMQIVLTLDTGCRCAAPHMFTVDPDWRVWVAHRKNQTLRELYS